ncbi:GNAT family N-acetyltransferase [Sphingomonas sp. HT-1]|uniref:GNAT family N-acetyltransferase n=1 Tax=unclassified Sphingomonas TaxID=196159 RepID=UPI0002FB9481|nr:MULTISPECIES: N-acetyltransferase [unclassified Sphingomonas]KTF68963.1 GCN5 family acetyltransferase [Sphingomonas sp. WG]
MTRLVSLDSIDSGGVEALLDRAFGADRHLRTAYRVRRGTMPISPLSFAALDEEARLIGSIQSWPVALASDTGPLVPLVMVGPVAVEPAHQQAGIGRKLMHHMLDAADASALPGAEALMLIGDPEYYGRFFGFDSSRTGRWRMPGPFEPRRLLARGPAVPNCAGTLVPRLREAA